MTDAPTPKPVPKACENCRYVSGHAPTCITLLAEKLQSWGGHRAR